MADVRPFTGLRFNPDRVDVSKVICPPFDVISPAEQVAYHERDPHNAIRIELGLGPADAAQPNNRYDTAAQAMADWQRAGILVRDAAPSLYLYDHAFVYGGRQRTRRGLLVAGRLHDWSEGVVLPHEGTRAGPKQDRLALMRAVETNVSPLWLLCRDPHGTVAAAVAAARHADPLLVAETPGERHELRRVSDFATVDAAMRWFAGSTLYIADGHHRYETAQLYRDERRRAAKAAGRTPDPDAGHEFALMLLVALDDPGLIVLPTHRVVRGPGRSSDEIRQALSRWLTLTPLSLPTGDDTIVGEALERALAEVGRAGSHVFGLYEREGAWLLRPRDDVDWRARLPSGHSEVWQQLDVAVLDALAIRDVLGIVAEGESARADATSDAPSDRLAYVSDFPGAVTAVRLGGADQAYLLNATPLNQVCAVADARDRMPPKSTFLFPKPVTGLVMHPLDGSRAWPLRR
ncbi:MAG: DUF1015 domain-containing protein [Chloroflexi bacterium]|nr:DUF1015 domain-containing protein [Chloroflexota bacterium]